MFFQPKKILVATDFSSHARAAADAAGVMARAFDGKVTLAHVVPLTVYTDLANHLEPRSLGMADLRETIERRVKADLESELARLKTDGVEAGFIMVDGPPAPELAKVAKEGNYDLVVIGTHGRTGLMHLALGSVAENLVRLSSVPEVQR